MVHDESGLVAAGSRRDLDPLFAPRSVVVVGASGTPGKWGYFLAQGALEGEHLRRVYFVNRSGSDVLGRRAHRSLAELPEAPEAPDLVAIAVPGTAFEAQSMRPSTQGRGRSLRSAPASASPGPRPGRVDLAERQRRPRDRRVPGGVRPRDLALRVRLATRPTSTRPTSCRASPPTSGLV